MPRRVMCLLIASSVLCFGTTQPAYASGRFAENQHGWNVTIINNVGAALIYLPDDSYHVYRTHNIIWPNTAEDPDAWTLGEDAFGTPANMFIGYEPYDPYRPGFYRFIAIRSEWSMRNNTYIMWTECGVYRVLDGMKQKFQLADGSFPACTVIQSDLTKPVVVQFNPF